MLPAKVHKQIGERNAYNRRQAGAAPGLPPMRAIPDEELIANLVANGNPRWSAEQIRDNPQLRFAATKFLFDCEDAARGDRAAKARVDMVKSMWVRLRVEELLADDPTRMFTDHILDPKDLL